MNNIRYDLLTLMNRNNKSQNSKKKKQLLAKATKLIENKSLGILLLTEIDKDGKDIVHSLTYKCDGLHAKKIIEILLHEIPEIREKAEEVLEAESDKTTVSKMVR
jgi:5S rRNA maturation endonuclease (ribonuclease M5)